MAEFEAGIRRSMFDEASNDYAGWYNQAAVVAGEMFPNDPTLADAANEAMFVHLADLSEELSERTEFIPAWVAVDQVEDWIAGRAAAAVADNVTLAGRLEDWRSTEAGHVYGAVERVGEPTELDAWRAKKLVKETPAQLPEAIADIAQEGMAFLAGAVRDPAVRRGLEIARTDPDKYAAYATHLVGASTFKVVERHHITDKAFALQLNGHLTQLSQDFINDRVWESYRG